jgi:hypothetical protein
MHLACAARPGISFVVCKLSWFVANPGNYHWHAHEIVMRYIMGTMIYGIHSYKHTILTGSRMEAELTSLDATIVQAKWLHELLTELPMVEKPIPAILMNRDNQIVIVKLNSSNDDMKGSKHVKRRLRSVRKLKNSEVIALDYIQMAKNLAYPFTKGQPRSMIVLASMDMGLRPT